MKTLLERIFDQFDIEDREAKEYEVCLAQQKEKEMNDELVELDAMSEDEACTLYNVDSKAEASQAIKEYYQYIA
jgi:hypothetical protein